MIIADNRILLDDGVDGEEEECRMPAPVQASGHVYEDSLFLWTGMERSWDGGVRLFRLDLPVNVNSQPQLVWTSDFSDDEIIRVLESSGRDGALLILTENAETGNRLQARGLHGELHWQIKGRSLPNVLWIDNVTWTAEDDGKLYVVCTMEGDEDTEAVGVLTTRWEEPTELPSNNWQRCPEMEAILNGLPGICGHLTHAAEGLVLGRTDRSEICCSSCRCCCCYCCCFDRYCGKDTSRFVFLDRPDQVIEIPGIIQTLSATPQGEAWVSLSLYREGYTTTGWLRREGYEEIKRINVENKCQPWVFQV
jgi:hypothetical protein